MASGQRRTASTSASAATPIPRLTPPQSQGYTEVAKSVLDRLRNGVRRSSSHTATPDPSKSLGPRRYVPTSRQDASFRTGLKIRALDINQARTHVVLAGGKILKTVRIDDTPSCAEEFNLRTAAVNVPWTNGTERDVDQKASFQQEVVDPAALDRETFNIEDVAWSNNEFKDSIATAARNGKIMLYNIKRPGMEIARLHEHLQQVHKVDFNPLEGGVLLSGSQDGTVRLWDLRSLQRSAMLCSSRETYQGRSQGVRHVKWSPTSTWTFAFSTDNGGIQRWDTRNNRTPLLKLLAHDGHCNSIDWHPDGRHLASGGEDGFVKIWNMASDEPRPKAIMNLRAPHGIQNVRWRPSCYITESPDAGIKQCTHLATSYRSYPVVHVWDLRRPHIPFREIHHTMNSGTTDMLWRSRDLLWTVGPEGDFTQTDVPFAAKTLDRRPTSTFARSPTGEVTLFILKRQTHHGHKNELKTRTAQSDISSKPQAPLNQDLGLGRSPGDDSIDEKFLDSFSRVSSRRRRSTTPTFKASKSTGTATPSIEDTTKSDTVDLARALNDYINFRPAQIPKFGPIPGAESGLITTYMAQKCKGPPTDLTLDLNYVMNIRSLFDQNAIYAQRASRYREAQTWRIVGAQLEKDLRIRAAQNRRKRNTSTTKGDSLAVEAATANSLQNRSPLPTVKINHAIRTLPTFENTTKGQTRKTIESTSNVPTPLAMPVRHGDGKGFEVQHAMLDVAGDLQLPPLLLNPQRDDYNTAATRTGNASSSEGTISSNSAEDDQGRLKKQNGTSGHFDRQISSDSLAMFSMSTDSEPKMSKSASFISQDSSGFVSDNQPSPELNAESRDKSRRSSSPEAANRDLTGTDVNSPVPIFPASFDTGITFENLKHRNCRQVDSSNTAVEDSQLPANGLEQLESDILPLPTNGDIPMSSASDEYETPEVLNGARPKLTYFGFTTPPTPLLLPTHASRDFELDEDVILNDFVSSPPHPMSTSSLELTASKMVKELVVWYTEHGDTRMASQVFQLAASVLASPQPTHSAEPVPFDDHATNAFYDHLTGSVLNMSPGQASDVINSYHAAVKAMDLDPAFVESFLSLYHEELLAHNLWNTAARLRKACYPAFPSVYEQGLIDTNIGLLCLDCHNPINNGTNRMLCETCGARQAPCCVCSSNTSPFELYLGKKQPKVMESPLAMAAATAASGTATESSVWACCPVCNHSTHIACASVWFADSETRGACPTHGCLCECFRGGVREERAVMVEEKARKERTVRFLDG